MVKKKNILLTKILLLGKFISQMETMNFTTYVHVQGGSNMTGTDLCVNKLHCTAVVRP